MKKDVGWRWLAGLLILLALGLAGCGGGGGETVKTARSAPPAEPDAWHPEYFAGAIRSVKSEPGRLAVELSVPAGAPAPVTPVQINFCLPPDQRFEVKIRRYAVGTTVVQALETQDQPTSTGAARQIRPDSIRPERVRPDRIRADEVLSLLSKGFMRENAIYQLNIEPGFFGVWGGMQAKNPCELTATLEITWPDSDVGAAAFTPPPGGGRGMNEVLRHLVANPEDIGHWPPRKLPLVSGSQAAPTDPRALAPDGSRWFRLKVARDGLVRLTVKDLARAGGVGTEGAAGRETLGRVRIFTEGKAVPAWRVKLAGGEEALLFYGWKSRKPYDAQQNYWLALSDKAPAMEGLAATSATLKGTSQALARPLATLHKTMRLNRDNVLKLNFFDAFLRINAFTWLDRELIMDQPTSIPLHLDAPAALAENSVLTGTIKFYPEGNPALWTGTEAELRYGSRTLAQFKFTPQDESFTRPIALPAMIFHDNRTLMSLEVTKPTTATLATDDNHEGIWLDEVEAGYEGYPSLEEGRLTLDRQAVGGTKTTGTLFRIALGGPGMMTSTNREPGAGYGTGAGTGLFALAVNPEAREAHRLAIEGGLLTFTADGRTQGEVFDTGAAALEATLEPVAWPDSAMGSEGADVLIVTHAMFLDAVKPLVELNKKRGLKTRVVDVQGIYDLFSDGMISPPAIRDYLAYAAGHWQGGLPQYLLLFGDCSEDYQDQYRSKARNLVPSYTYGTGPEQCASDYWYSLLIGEDALPDLIVSRISVGNLEDARAVVEKTVRYAGGPMLGPWRGRVALVTDNMLEYRKMAEQSRRTDTPAAIQTQRVYLDELPLEDNWYLPPGRLDRGGENEENSVRKVSGAATNAIKDTLNSGTTVMEYLGHGSPNLWAHERIWFGGGSDKRDSLYLKAGGRYAFIINYTCATGKIDYPIEPWNVCIAEDFLRTPDGGAIGLFVPSGSGSPPKQELLMHQWHRALYRDRERGIGELATLVRTRYAMEQPGEYHLFMYMLLGDPTAELQLATQWRDLEVTPAVSAPIGRAIQVALKGMEPETGQAQLWIENEHGETVWQGPTFAYQGGAIQQAATLPATEGAGEAAAPQRLRVALYAWNEKEGRDLLAAGRVALERPTVLIRSARAVRTGEKGMGFALELENLGRGASGELKLKVQACAADGAAAPLAEQTLTLEGGQRRRVELASAGGWAQGAKAQGAKGEPPCFEAVLTLPQPPDDPSQPNPQKVRFAPAPAAGWTGWVSALGHWQSRPSGDEITVVALSGAKPAAGHYAALRGVNNNLLTTFPMKFAAAGEGFVSTATLPTEFKRRLTAGGAVELIETAPGAPPRTVSRMSLGEVPRSAPALRLLQDSVKIHPAAPSDGETIFIEFNVENRGDGPTEIARPALLDKALGAGGKELPYRSGLDHAEIPALAPGRSWPVRLRWDPDGDAGFQTVTIDANPAAGRSEAAVNEQAMAYRFYVHTKSKLKLLPLQVGKKGKDKDGKTFILLEDVVNEGETDAHNVEVRFYRLHEKKEENLIQTVLLEKVPAKGRAQARLECQLDAANDHPLAEARLKGSAQSITN